LDLTEFSKFWIGSGSQNMTVRSSLGNTRTKHNQLPAIIWNLYYDPTKLLKADNCIIIASN